MAILLAIGLVLAACSPAESESTTTTPGDEPSTTEGGGGPTTTGAPDGDIATDVGVDLEAGTISVGLLSDLTGPFSSLVQVIVAGHEAYWADVNANGGIGGLTVDVEAVDTAYDAATHVQRYEELKDSVVAFGHSTGTPQTVAIVPQLVEDGILAIPLTWYSGWTDPTFNSNLLHHGAPYCVESMNVLSYMKEQMGDAATTIAIASMGGDYGLDSHEGAKLAADGLGLEIVYDGPGAVIVGDDTSYATVASEIVAADPDIVWLTATPGAWGPIFGQALAAGFTTAAWSGAGPSYNPAFIAPDSQIRDAVAAMTTWGTYYTVWSDDAPGVEAAKALVADVLPQPVSAVLEGIVEARIMHAALQAAYDSGDMTQAGVLAAAKSLENVSFDGIAPDESFVGTPDEQLQRATTIWTVDLAGLEDGTHAGEIVAEKDYVSDLAASFEFTQACYVLE
jgi:ABC-type branched-subunit amino acid transport system substrate-binding protein